MVGPHCTGALGHRPDFAGSVAVENGLAACLAVQQHRLLAEIVATFRPLFRLRRYFHRNYKIFIGFLLRIKFAGLTLCFDISPLFSRPYCHCVAFVDVLVQNGGVAAWQMSKSFTFLLCMMKHAARMR